MTRPTYTIRCQKCNEQTEINDDTVDEIMDVFGRLSSVQKTFLIFCGMSMGGLLIAMLLEIFR